MSQITEPSENMPQQTAETDSNACQGVLLYSWRLPYTSFRINIFSGVIRQPGIFERFFWGLPFTKILLKSPAKSHKEAFKQIILILGAAFFPILLTAMINPGLMKAVSWKDLLDTYFASLNNTLKLGDLFIYVATFCAPMGWIIYKYNDSGKSFPNLYSYSISIIVIWSVSILFFFLSRTTDQVIASLSPLINIVGYSLLAVIVLLAYLAMVCEENLNNPNFDFEELANQSSEATSKKLLKTRRRRNER